LACYKAELYRDALLPLENDLKAHPENVATKQLLGLSYFMTDDYPRASKLLADVVAAKPGEAALYYPLRYLNQPAKDRRGQSLYWTDGGAGQ
jgi:hypothetical protein